MREVLDMSREGTEKFDILTDEGGKFCDCVMKGNKAVYISKEGRIDISSLMEQTYDRRARGSRDR